MDSEIMISMLHSKDTSKAFEYLKELEGLSVNSSIF